jgi:hypothetical protein
MGTLVCRQSSRSFLDYSSWAPIILIQLLSRLQYVGNNARELSLTIPKANAIIVNITDIQEQFDLLIDEAHCQYVELCQDLIYFIRYSEDWFHSIVNKCQIVGSEIWTMISGQWEVDPQKEQALDSRLEWWNQEVLLLQMGCDYCKYKIQRHTSKTNINLLNQPTPHNPDPEIWQTLMTIMHQQKKITMDYILSRCNIDWAKEIHTTLILQRQ